ncbi:MAG TPA: sugar ABC transporter ATP-binding protein [Pseudonocardiaceae bacterium]|jgi:ribose transport system ATP-binding protein|nr:sugar ABC transporter ATP-binding protein [Pseudonocardiaceae bacterium]
MGEPVLAAVGVGKDFPGVRALDDVDLRLAPGSVHALLGENGAGKSTLIKILTGVHRPDRGHLELDGTPTVLSGPHSASVSGIGAVHQERNLVPGFTIAENIVLPRMPGRRGVLDRRAARATAARCLRLLDVGLDPDTEVASLSVAQMQLVEIARALAMDSRVLLLDEPTASITPDEAQRLFDVVRALTEHGTAVLFVSHKLDEVFAICDTLTVLRDGRAVLSSAPLVDHTQDDVVGLMVGRAQETLRLPPRTVPDGPPLLELDGVATGAGHRDVSLSVRAGEIVGLYGLVGAGRTELARAVLGLAPITSGTVRVAGRPARIRGVRDALTRYRIGYVTENRKEEGVFLDQSVARNVAVTVWRRLAGRFGRVTKQSERSLLAMFTERLGIRLSGPDQLAGQLSGGNQQKVSLAKWLAARTEILIIDEPTVGIDVRTKAAFHELIWGLAAEGMAILLITSDLAEMITLADRILVMRDFRLRGETTGDRDYDTTSVRVMRLIHADSLHTG